MVSHAEINLVLNDVFAEFELRANRQNCFVDGAENAGEIHHHVSGIFYNYLSNRPNWLAAK